MAQGPFKVGPVARQSLHPSGIAKNTFDPVSIPLIRAASDAFNSRRGLKPGGSPLRPEELSSAEAHPAEPFECEPTTGEVGRKVKMFFSFINLYDAFFLQIR